MASSKRNPLLRNNNAEFNKVIGSLGEEIEDQNLEIIDGGTDWGAAGVTFAVYTWANNAVTQKHKCGNVFTASCECGGCSSC